MALRLPKQLLEQKVAQAAAEVLSPHRVGYWSSDHIQEAKSLNGWNALAINAISRQAARAHAYVYQDATSNAVGMRKAYRSLYGATWRQQVQDGTAQLADDSNYITQLVHRPNPGSTAAAFQWEFVQQMHLHGVCLIFNRPTLDGQRTAQRYILPVSVTQPVYPGEDRNFPNGGVKIVPHMAGLGWFNNAITSLLGRTIPIENLSIIRYPHATYRGDGQSPTDSAGWWIDSALMVDMQRWKQMKRGPRPFGIVAVKDGVGEISDEMLERIEDRLNAKLSEQEYDERAIALGAGVDFSRDTTPTDMAYVEAFDQLGQAILAVHGVGKAFVGMTENMTYGSNAAAHQMAMSVVQGDLDFLGADYTQLAEEEGQSVAVEYEAQPIDDPQLIEQQLATDLTAGTMLGKEWRAKRGLPPFGDWRDNARVTSAGLVDDSRGPTMVPGATLEGSQPAATEPVASTGEWAGLSRQQLVRNRRALEDVLSGVADGSMSEVVARVQLQAIGMSPQNIELLLEDLRDGTLDNAPPELEGLASELEAAKSLRVRKLAKSVVRRMLAQDHGPVIAIDLDGTLAEQLPGPFDPAVIGPPNTEQVEMVRKLQEAGCGIVIFTCRDTDEHVAEWLDANNVPWDAINENPTGAVSSRKVFADVYYDDKAINVSGGLEAIAKLLPDSDAKRKLLSGIPKSHKFGAVMLELPEQVATSIKAMAANLPAGVLGAEGAEDWPHVTLLYGLVGMPLDEIVDAVRKIEKMDVVFGATSAFVNPDATVLKLDVDSPSLHKQRKRLTGALPYVETHPQYVPHITVAYLKPGGYESLYGPNELTGKVATLTHAVISMPDGRKVRVPLR